MTDDGHAIRVRLIFFACERASQLGLHAQVNSGLPQGMELAYDGLVLRFDAQVGRTHI